MCLHCFSTLQCGGGEGVALNLQVNSVYLSFSCMFLCLSVSLSSKQLLRLFVYLLVLPPVTFHKLHPPRYLRHKNVHSGGATQRNRIDVLESLLDTVPFRGIKGG